MKSILLALVLGLLGSMAAACPDWRAGTGAYYSYTGSQLYQPRYFSVTAGGQYELSSRCRHIYNVLGSDRGPGFFTRPPDFTVDINGLDRYILQIGVSSGCDTALLINTPLESWFYDDDDGNGVDAMIELTRPSSGQYDIWIGTYDGTYCEATMRLETF